MLSKPWILAAALCAAALPTTASAAVTEASFQMRTTADLVDLCSEPATAPMGTAAINFCHGFAVGVYRVLEEQNEARRPGNKTFCVPETAGPSRDEAIANFVQWAKATPSVLTQRPANGLTSYLTTKFPCPRGK